MEELKSISDIEIIEDLDCGTVAVLKGATLVEDILLVRDYAVTNNIPYYVAIKDEKDGSQKRYCVNESGTPIVIEPTATLQYGVNDKYVAPEIKENDEAESATDETVTETKVDEAEAVEEEPTEVSAEEIIEPINEPVVETKPVTDKVTNNDVDNSIPFVPVANVTFDEDKLKELVKEEVDKVRVEYDKLIIDKDAEIAQLKDKIETLELAQNDVDIAEYVVTLEDVVEFMKSHGLTSLSIKGE